MFNWFKKPAKVKLIVDGAYALDYLSILKVKDIFYPTPQNSINREECTNYLSNQIGNFDDIILSDEYNELYEANAELFIKIDQLRNGDNEVTAKELDDLNIKRFKAKQKIQEKYFRAGLTETKTKI